MNTRRTKGLLIATLVGLLAAGCSEETVVEPPVVRPVKMIEIGGPDSDTTRELPGTIRATQSADISFQVGGRMTSLLVTEGESVVEGQELARLDPRDFQADFDQADAAFRKAQSDLNRSERIYEQDSGAISTAKIETDRKAVEVAEAALRKAEKAVDDTVLRAPFDGIIARRLVDEFQNLQPKEAVVVLQDLESLEIEVSVPERDVAQSESQRNPAQTTRQIRPRVHISSLPGLEFPARLVEFSTTADPATRTFQARLRFDRPGDQNILPGMTARVIYDAISETGFRLPSNATFADASGNANVWLVDDATMTVSARAVTLGNLTGDEVAVVSGLNAGDLVAVSGVSQLRAGVQVRRYEN
jgi:RND family efflux transporter MFP subunit